MPTTQQILASATIEQLTATEKSLTAELAVLKIRHKDAQNRLAKTDSSSSRWGELIQKQQTSENRMKEILEDLHAIYGEAERRMLHAHAEAQSGASTTP